MITMSLLTMPAILVLLMLIVSQTASFTSTMKLARNRRRLMLQGSLLGGIFSGGQDNNAKAAVPKSSKGATNEIIKTVNGMRHRRLGGSDIVVSELGLGTQVSRHRGLCDQILVDEPCHRTSLIYLIPH
jgi:hypothetical protein